MSKEASEKLSFEQLANLKKPILDQVSSSLKGSKLLVILSDEGGLPVYTRSIQVDETTGQISDRNDMDFSPNNEQILLMTGLIEAIMQLKDIVKPTLVDLSQSGRIDVPLFVDYARVPNGMSLVAISTSPEFQQLPSSILKEYMNLHSELDNLDYNNWAVSFEKAITAPLSEDRDIYLKILTQIKRDLAEFVSNILVYNEEGNFLFSTSKNAKENMVSDPLLNTISRYIKQEYKMNKYRSNMSLIGAKRLSSSVIWHFKCYDRIFVFFTYLIPEMYDFETLKTELIRFIVNNLDKFINTLQSHPEYPSEIKKTVQNTRFIFLT